jgi:hypothetical protein
MFWIMQIIKMYIKINEFVFKYNVQCKRRKQCK